MRTLNVFSAAIKNCPDLRMACIFFRFFLGFLVSDLVSFCTFTHIGGHHVVSFCSSLLCSSARLSASLWWSVRPCRFSSPPLSFGRFLGRCCRCRSASSFGGFWWLIARVFAALVICLARSVPWSPASLRVAWGRCSLVAPLARIGLCVLPPAAGPWCFRPLAFMSPAGRGPLLWWPALSRSFALSLALLPLWPALSSARALPPSARPRRRPPAFVVAGPAHGPLWPWPPVWACRCSFFGAGPARRLCLLGVGPGPWWPRVGSPVLGPGLPPRGSSGFLARDAPAALFGRVRVAACHARQAASFKFFRICPPTPPFL